MNNILNILKAIPALFLLVLGVWLVLGMLFMFLFSGCAHQPPAQPDWNSTPMPTDRMYAKTRSFTHQRGGEDNGKGEWHNHGKTI